MALKHGDVLRNLGRLPEHLKFGSVFYQLVTTGRGICLPKRPPFFLTGYSICGAFKLAIGVSLAQLVSLKMDMVLILIKSQAASQHSKVMDCVFEALGDIPEAMESAQKYVLIYKDTHDHSLERKTFDLYLAVLRALIQIMQFFADDGFSTYPPFLLYKIHDTRYMILILT